MMAQWTRRLGIFTFFMALIAGITAWILYETDQTARNAARAYLISNELTIETIRTKEGKISRWIISPIIENGGSTSTVNATIVTGLKALEAPMTEPREIVVLDKKDTRHFVLGPRSKNSKIVAPMHITPESLPALRSGNPRTFVLGEVNYDDVYAAPHVTRFCYFCGLIPRILESRTSHIRSAPADPTAQTRSASKRSNGAPRPGESTGGLPGALRHLIAPSTVAVSGFLRVPCFS
jgi:hypothetical protein